MVQGGSQATNCSRDMETPCEAAPSSKSCTSHGCWSVTGALGVGWSISQGTASGTPEEAVSSASPCIGEAGDIILLQLEARECLQLCLLLTGLPLPALTQPVFPEIPGRGKAPCLICQPHTSRCLTALLAGYLKALWSSCSAQMRILTPARVLTLATTCPCTDRYHGALGSSAVNCPNCCGGGMSSGSLLPSHSPLGLSCGP